MVCCPPNEATPETRSEKLLSDLGGYSVRFVEAIYVRVNFSLAVVLVKFSRVN